MGFIKDKAEVIVSCLAADRKIEGRRKTTEMGPLILR